MSMCYLRSMSPLHLQYLKNMGVTATLVVSLVREGRLWGLIACHHYSPRNLRFAVRSACRPAGRSGLDAHRGDRELRPCAGRDPGAPARAAAGRGDVDRRRLAARAVPQSAQPAAAARGHRRGAVPRRRAADRRRGAVDAPSCARSLQWIEAQPCDGLFSCYSVARANPALDIADADRQRRPGGQAVGVAARLPDVVSQGAAADASHGPATRPSRSLGNDPLELSPRRSFAAWSEIVRGTGAAVDAAARWSLARAFGGSL